MTLIGATLIYEMRAADVEAAEDDLLAYLSSHPGLDYEGGSVLKLFVFEAGREWKAEPAPEENQSDVSG